MPNIEFIALLVSFVLGFATIFYYMVSIQGKRFGDMNNRFVDLDKRFGDMNNRIGDLDKRFGDMNNRIDDLDKRIIDLNAHMNARIGDLEQANRRS